MLLHHDERGVLWLDDLQWQQAEDDENWMTNQAIRCHAADTDDQDEGHHHPTGHHPPSDHADQCHERATRRIQGRDDQYAGDQCIRAAADDTVNQMIHNYLVQLHAEKFVLMVSTFAHSVFNCCTQRICDAMASYSAVQCSEVAKMMMQYLRQITMRTAAAVI
jgi:hypothetical protein